jgi:hypothetical protein
MFKLLKVKASLDDEPDDCGEEATDDNKPAADNDEYIDNNLDQRPSEWFFHGWIAFNLFGPFAPTKRRLSLLEIGRQKGLSSPNPHEDNLPPTKNYEEHNKSSTTCLLPLFHEA